MEFIKDIEKSNGAIIRISLQNYKGYEFIDVRQYYLDDGADEYKPTKKGITIHPESLNEEPTEVFESLKKSGFTYAPSSHTPAPLMDRVRSTPTMACSLKPMRRIAMSVCHRQPLPLIKKACFREEKSSPNTYPTSSSFIMPRGIRTRMASTPKAAGMDSARTLFRSRIIK